MTKVVRYVNNHNHNNREKNKNISIFFESLLLIDNVLEQSVLQYDNHNKGKPIGAKCDGYPHFVNLVEPANQRFCIRCCEFKV